MTLIFVLAFNFVPVCAQKNKAIDSLETALNKGKLSNENEVILLNDLSYEYVEIDARVAQDYAQRALQTASAMGNKKRIAESYHRLGTALYNRQKLDSAKQCFAKSSLLFTQLGEKDNLGPVYNEMGNVEADQGNYEKSMEYYHQALKIFEQTKNEQKAAIVLSNLGALYINLGNIEKMFEYTKQALVKHRALGNKMGIASCQTNLAEYYFQKNDTFNVIKALTEAQQLFHELNAKINEANALGSIGDYYSVFYSNFDKALDYYHQSANLLAPGDNKNLVMDNFRKTSLVYYKMKDYGKSLTYAQKAMAVTDTSNLSYMQLNYYLLTYCYMGLRDFPNGEHSFDKYVELSNKVNQDNQAKRIAEMEVKYQTEKKQQKIEILEKAKKINRLYQIGLIILLILVVVISLFIITSIRHKQAFSKQEAELGKQKLKELEKEHQLMATKLVLQGEEAERSRLARDLHDGLGGLLSGVKLALSHVKGNVVLSSETVVQYDNALNLLDNSMNELRRVAHNMMPETLVKFGLKDALQDFCERIGSKNDLKLNFKVFGNTDRFNQTLETSVYRIAQELVNNAIKHAGAAEIMVQLVQDNHRVHLVVQDNGKGFDITKVDPLKSSGLQNIRARVESFGGHLDINSQPGIGTEISVEFSIV